MKKIHYFYVWLWTMALLVAGCQDLREPYNTVPVVTTGNAVLEGNHVTLEGEIRGYIPSGSHCYILLSLNEDMSDAVTWDVVAYGSTYRAFPDIDLQAATTYYYVICIQAYETEIRGEVRSFTTPDQLRIGQVTLTDWDGTTQEFHSEMPMGVTFIGNDFYNHNLQTSYSENGGWTFAGSIPFGVVNQVYAYWPYSEEYLAEGNTAFLPIQTYKYTGTDLLYAAADISADNTVVNLNLRHMMARVIFHINIDEMYSDDWLVINSIRIIQPNLLPTMGQLDLASGQLQGYDYSEPLGYDTPFEVGKESPQTITLYSLPTRQGGTFDVALTLGNDTTLTTELEAEWSQGGSYEYTINIEQNTISIEGVYVEGWQDNSQGGDVTVFD